MMLAIKRQECDDWIIAVRNGVDWRVAQSADGVPHSPVLRVRVLTFPHQAYPNSSGHSRAV
jgi:hypothetical protein